MFWPQPPATIAEKKAQCEADWKAYRDNDDSNPLAALRHMHSLSNIVFSNGELDICYSGAFTSNISVARDLLAVNIPMQVLLGPTAPVPHRRTVARSHPYSSAPPLLCSQQDHHAAACLPII